MERIYNKLVRDNIPEIISKNKEIPVIRILNDVEYKQKLEEKLYEEYKEVIEAKGLERLEELADMLEIIKAMANIEGSNLEDIVKISSEKANKRGAFDKKIFLEKVIIEKD